MFKKGCFLFGMLAEADELSVAIDVFEELPSYDDGGGWSRIDIVRDNFTARTGKRPEQDAALMVADPMMLRADDIRARLKNAGIRKFSIDGAQFMIAVGGRDRNKRWLTTYDARRLSKGNDRGSGNTAAPPRHQFLRCRLRRFLIACLSVRNILNGQESR